ncbi:MAG: DNA adenine methylase [Henriciella sp.]|nr:DNA adenine methylase [Henriciella sp.]
MESTPVRSVSPAAPYLGGKKNLADQLCQLIETTDHVTYAEVFVGMGGVFLRRRSRPKVEVINDISRDVSTFFRVLQRHFVAFSEMLRYQVASRAEFERLIDTDPDTLTDLERSARFLYLQRMAYGGKVTGRSFGVDATKPSRFDVTRIVPMLQDLHERLSGVVIERLPYGEFITRYDKPGTLFYLDPPYWNGETDYGPDVFSRDDFETLAARLQTIEGKFIFSINDVPEIRALFDWAVLIPVSHRFSIAGGAGTEANELIITSDLGHKKLL